MRRHVVKKKDKEEPPGNLYMSKNSMRKQQLSHSLKKFFPYVVICILLFDRHRSSCQHPDRAAAAAPSAVATDSDLRLVGADKQQKQNNADADRLHQLPSSEEIPSAIEELYRTVTPDRLARIASEHHEHYKDAEPFPHIAIDGIFPDSILQKVIEEHPESSLDGRGCLTDATNCFSKRKQNKKSAIEDETKMGLHTRVLFSFLKSSIFTNFLERLTGIKDIVPDPHFRGSGLHFTAPGGNLNVHADFNRYKQYKLDRRVNLFIYLNNDWPDQYGGHLDLWSRDMKTCYERIAPKLGRFVVFSSTDFSYHGHPEPISAPNGRARRSMALYYYTNGRPSNECLNGDCTGNDHSTLFQTPKGCKKCLDDACRRERTLLPPTWMAD